MTDELTPSLEGRRPFNARCGKCSHTWPAAWLPMEMSLVAKLTIGIHCPACGNGPKGIFVATTPSSAPTEKASA